MKTKKLSDQKLIKLLNIDAKTLKRFRQIQKQTIAEAKQMAKRRGTIKVLGISGSARGLYDMAQQDANSESLLMTCLDHCKKLGAKTELIKLRTFRIEHCRACYSTVNTQCHFYCTCYPKGTPRADDMSNILYDKLLSADAIIFATPINNFNVSTLMKIFVDRCISLDGSLPPANRQAPKSKELNIKHMKFIELNADINIPGSGMLRRFLGKVAGIITVGHEAGASLAIANMFLTLNHYGMLFPPFSNMYAMSNVCFSTHRDKEIVLSKCYEEETKLLATNIMNTIGLVRKIKPTAWVYDYASN